MMTDLTATVITFNEEENIRDCLQSLQWVPHIVVVDSGSTDRTVEIAKEFTEHVSVTDWPGHIQHKNRAIDFAPTDWILSLDAQERVPPELRKELPEVLSSEPRFAGFSMPRLTWHLGRWIRHGGWYPDRKIRLFDRRKARWAGVNPHDHIELDGKASALAGEILHYSYRDLQQHIDRIDFFTSIAARENDVRGKRGHVFGMFLRAPWKFIRMYLFKKGWKDGFAGFILASIAAFSVFLKYACLWERRSLRGRGIDPDSMPRHHRGPEWRAPSRPPEVTEANS